MEEGKSDFQFRYRLSFLNTYLLRFLGIWISNPIIVDYLGITFSHLTISDEIEHGSKVTHWDDFPACEILPIRRGGRDRLCGR
ncbi:hypothetical protein J2X69_002652 [Algoriphagus sp. 4150]|nr:hypothetical protein [Algoriphagus sp. 4150]